MTSLTQNPNLSQTTSTAPPHDLVPDEERKQKLELDVETYLHSMTDEAKQKLNSVLAKAHLTPEERKRLAAKHFGVVKKFLPLAEKKLRMLLEWEHQERQGICGEQVGSESIVKEQQAISGRIERERKNKPLPALPLQPPKSKPEPLPESTMPDPPPDCKLEHHVPEGVLSSRTTRQFRASCITSITSREAYFILNNSPLARSSSTGQIQKRSRHTIMHEVWKPSITREEDARMLRTFTRARRGGTAGATPSFKVPSVLSGAFSDLLHPMSENMRRERAEVRAESDTSSFMAPPVLSLVFSDSHDTLLNMNECGSTHSAEQAWSSLCGSPTPKRKRHLTEEAHERASAIEFRPYEDSSQTPDDSWFRLQDMEYYFQEEWSPDDFEEHGPDDAFDVRSRRSWDHERQIQGGLYNGQDDEDLVGNAEDIKRQREDKESKHREEELRRKEAEADRKEREAALREEETKRREEEVELKEKEAREREIGTRRREEEVLRKEQKVRSREIEARQKAETARRKEEEVRRMEEEARHRENGVRWKQEEAQRRMEEINIKAEEMQWKEEELCKREKKLRRREQNLNRREEEMWRGGEEETHRRKAEEGKSWFSSWRKKTKD